MRCAGLVDVGMSGITKEADIISHEENAPTTGEADSPLEEAFLSSFITASSPLTIDSATTSSATSSAPAPCPSVSPPYGGQTQSASWLMQTEHVQGPGQY